MTEAAGVLTGSGQIVDVKHYPVLVPSNWSMRLSDNSCSDHAMVFRRTELADLRERAAHGRSGR